MVKTRKRQRNYKIPISIIVGVVVLVAAIQFYLATCCASSNSDKIALEKSAIYPKAPELAGIAGYINTGSDISLEKLRKENKIVLVDFWTYTCINCQRTIPYLNSWYEKYSDDGFVIVGVHSPEFEFEKDYGNVKSAVEQFGIKYPVVQDNDFQTWRAYENRFWPRKYLIDIDGFIRFDHIGEGAYEETEKKIQELLRERADRLKTQLDLEKNISKPEGAVDVDYSKIKTPEIYLGHSFSRSPLGNPENFAVAQTHKYILPAPEEFEDNIVYLGGFWYSAPEYVELKEDGGFVGLKYSARDVNIVAAGNGTVSVWLDKKAVPDSDRGADVEGEIAKISGNRLYNIVSSESYGTRILELMVDGNVRIYTFTFG